MPEIRQNLMQILRRELIIDPEFAALIPPLTPDEFAGLENSILTEGCRDALIVWNNIIVDGHNRYRICTAHNIPYRVESKDFQNREAAMLWMLQNQLARRNLNDFQRVEIVRKCESAVKAQAEQRMLKGKSDPVINLPQGSKSRDELGKLAGVSGSTYEHAAAVLDNAPEPVVQAAREKSLSINAAYEITKLPEQQQAEIASRIQQGEKPKTAIANSKRKAQIPPPLSQPHAEQFPTHVYIKEFLDGAATLSDYPADCLLLLWVKPELLRLALTSPLWSGKNHFSYQGVAFVWTCGGEVRMLCLLGLRGKTQLSKTWHSRVIDVQHCGNEPFPDVFKDYILELATSASIE